MKCRAREGAQGRGGEGQEVEASAEANSWGRHDVEGALTGFGSTTTRFGAQSILFAPDSIINLVGL